MTPFQLPETGREAAFAKEDTMISFAEKEAVAGSFAELERREVSMGRVNYHYEGSVREKKIVVYHLHPNGNGFVYAGLLEGVETDAKGFVNIRDYGAEELRELIRRSIRSLGPAGEEADEEASAGEARDAGAAKERDEAREKAAGDANGLNAQAGREAQAGQGAQTGREAQSALEDPADEEGFTELREVWRDAAGHALELHLEPEDRMWYVFAGEQVDSAFETYEEAAEYLKEEGFTRS